MEIRHGIRARERVVFVHPGEEEEGGEQRAAEMRQEFSSSFPPPPILLLCLLLLLLFSVCVFSEEKLSETRSAREEEQ